jgi:ribonuclease P/MRP protein subunit RPP40
MLQNNVDKLQAWSNEWLLKLNIKKCKIISFGTDKNSIIKHEYSITMNQIPTPLGREQYMTDLGIVLDENLKFSRHIHDKVNKAYSMLGVIKRNFKHLSKDTFVLLYKSMVRSHIEYGTVWSPYRKMDIEELEKVQKRATKMIHSFDKLNYNERLKKCKLTTLKLRRYRGDMIETYKILTGIYDGEVVPTMKLNKDTRTRGNSMKLETNRTRL